MDLRSRIAVSVFGLRTINLETGTVCWFKYLAKCGSEEVHKLTQGGNALSNSNAEYSL